MYTCLAFFNVLHDQYCIFKKYTLYYLLKIRLITTTFCCYAPSGCELMMAS